MGDDNDEKYSLNSNEGSLLWQDNDVSTFIKDHPFKAFEIAQKYSRKLRIYGCFCKYDLCFGIEALVEDIRQLSMHCGRLAKALWLSSLLHMTSNGDDDEEFFLV